MAAVPARRRGLVALATRETARVLKLWTQTVAAPILSSFLFIVVFGLSLGTRIDAIDGIAYDAYIVPGLITMAMVQAAYSNNASSIFQARFERYINDVLSAPMRPWEVNLGITLGGVLRSLLVGAGLFVLSLLVTAVPVREPLVLLAAVALLVGLFGSLGIVVGIYAESFDHHMAVNSIAILPLAFLGGVFYSVESLPSPGALATQPDLPPRPGHALRLPGRERRARRNRPGRHGPPHARRGGLEHPPVLHGSPTEGLVAHPAQRPDRRAHPSRSRAGRGAAGRRAGG
jgi:ABC-2 type transport system permease protein